MFRTLSNVFIDIFTGHSSSFLSSLQFLKYIWTGIKWIKSKIWNFIVSIIWTVIKLVLGLIDAFSYIINSLLGIDTTLDDYTNIAKSIGGSGSRNYLDTLVDVFRALIGVSIILLLVFTIVAVIRQEVDFAKSGFVTDSKKGKGNNKMGILKNLFRNLMGIIVLPLAMICVIVGVNSILSAFNKALQGDNQNVSLAGQVLYASTYDANKYRRYANSNQRIPIIIKAYDSDKYSVYETDQLALEIRKVSVQNKLKEVATNTANKSFLSFEKSLTYKNNKFYNSTDFGDYFEQFVCTPEQYYVMADFIDYVQKYSLNYYIKSIDDPNVEWKYVEDVVYKSSSNELNITYRDNSDLNGNGSSSDYYTLSLAPKNEVTSPISDAMDSIMAMLGVGSYGDNVYNTMERDDSGNYVNLVQWANEKCYLHFSAGFDRNTPSTWTDVDEILMYEYNRYSSNNTLSAFTFDQLTASESDPNYELATLDVMQIKYSTYYEEADVYLEKEPLNCVLINGNYYYVKESETKTDKFGNALYEIVSQNELNNNVVVRYLDPSYSLLHKTTDTATLKFSAGFNINDRTTWKTIDQVLLYEYYKNISIVMNDLGAYKFSDIKDGVGFDIYEIKEVVANVNEKNELISYSTTTNKYVIINGTYYQLNSSNTIGDLSEKYLLNSETEVKTHYNYYLQIKQNYINGFDTLEKKNAESFVKYRNIERFSDTNAEDDIFYVNFSLQLSEGFDYKDTSTWSYRDYFIFYLYVKYAVADSFESLKYTGIEGTIKKNGSQYCFFPKQSNYTSLDSEKANIYFDIDEIKKISELNINKTIDINEIKETNYIDTNDNDLFISYNSTSATFLKNNAETKLIIFSDDYDYYDVSTWTMSDLILNYFSSKSVINSASVLENSGYGSLKLEVRDGDNNLVDTIYTFGSYLGNYYCLSEKNLKNYKNVNGQKMNINSVEEFLNMNAFSFICSYNCLVKNNVITTYDDISASLFQNYENFVLDYDGLIDELVSDNFSEILTKAGKYTYTNESLDANDPSTWTMFDLICYTITGSAKSSISGNVIVKDNKKYFVIKDKAIPISEGVCAGTLSDGDNSLTVKKITYGTTYTDLETYYNSTISSLLKNNYEIAGLESLDTFKVKYTSNKTINKNSYVHNNDITILDAIILMTSESGKVENKTYYFNVYTDGDHEYLNVNGKYIQLTKEMSGLDAWIKYNPSHTFTLNSTSKAFTKSGLETYTSFDFYTTRTEDSTHLSTFSNLDYLVYAITDSVESSEYTIYKKDSKDYIFVSGNFIDCTSNRTELTMAGRTNGKDSDEKRRDNIDYLYDTYYSQYVANSASFDSNFARQITVYTTNFNKDQRISWTPINIILYKNGFLTGDGAQATFEGEYTISLNGDKTYFIYSKTDIIAGTKSIVIDITDIGYIDDPIAGELDSRKYLRNKDSAIYEQNLKLFCVLDNNLNFQKDGENVLTPEEVLNKNYKFNDLTTYLSGNSEVKNKNDLKVAFTNANNFNLNNVTTWTWYDLLYYSLFEESFAGESYFVYYSGSSETYAEITDGDKTYYVLSNDGTVKLTERFSDDGSVNVSYNSSDANSATLGFVAYKITNKTESLLNRYKFTSRNTNKTFYYVKNVFTGKFNGIYKLSNSTTEIQSNKTTDSYTYVVSNSDNVSAWSLFDFVIYYASSYTGDRSYHSQLETFGVSQYFVIGETYINITALSKTYNGDGLIVKKNADKTLSATRTLTTTCGFGDSEAVSGATKQDCVFAYNYDEEDVITNFKHDSNKITNTTTGFYAQLFKFSDNFNPSDYTTWTLSDMMIYYAFKNGFYGGAETFGTDYIEYYLEDNTLKTKVVRKELSTKNFQDFINIGGAPGYVSYMMTTDSFGNSSIRKVINFSNQKINDNGICYDYEVFMRLASRITSYITYTTTANDDTISVKMTEMRKATDISATDIPHFIYSVAFENAKVDFAYKNYYYFNYDTSKFYETYEKIDEKISSSVIYQILNYGQSDAQIKGTLNIKLSSGFDINDISTWTMLDYIIVYEYSREFEGNEFSEISFSDMMTVDNYFVLYAFDDDPISDGLLVLNINDAYYNVAEYVEKVNPDSETSMEYKLKSGVTSPASAGIITSAGASADKYGFRTLYEKINFTRNMTISGLMYDFGENSDSFNYEFENGDRIYRRIYQNTQALYKADFSDPKFSKYTISPYIKQVSWPEKIMTDMQVLYPDLNWSTLIATDGWLDTLGEFTSAYANGQFVSKNNSSNTTAAGLVLSEFFLSVSKEVSDGFGYFEYETLFDENVIKSLMLSLLGEESYTNLSKQAEIFVEMFNTSFAPILDEIARENEIEILDGQVNNFTMCVYKSYLATVLLSSDIGEYLYTIATRVYAQYTIYESLATAAGDYSGYYAYTSGQKDENGDEIDYFTYSSFYELVKYENMLSGQSSPVYTFNMKKAYESYAKEYGYSPSTITLNNSNFLNNYHLIYNYVNEKYRDTYSAGGRISDKSDVYCFMFDAYYSMLYANETNVKNTPTYLKLYKDYLDGNISRWGMVKDASISDTSKYISKYDTYKKARTISKFSAYSGLIKLMADRDYYQDEDSSEEENKNFFQKIWDGIKDKINELINSKTSFGVLYQSFSSSYQRKLKNLMSIMSDSLFDESDNGSNTAWQKLIDINEDLDLLIKEVTEIRDLDSVEGSSQGKTENGSRKMYADDYYVDALDDLNKIKLGVGNYISAQKMMDKIVKSSITYTLGQYGQNYVTDGFDFNIENKRYTFDSNLSATRLAEYVYGGSYLKKFNINPIYTDDEYDGLVSVSKVFDKKDGYLKTSLEMWPELRSFASELANYTSKLYYQTNLKNTASNVSDGILLTDYLKASIQISSGSRDLDSTTPEFLILYYLIKESDISADTFVRLIFADTTTTLNEMTCSDTMLSFAKIKEMAGVLDGTNGLSLDDLTNKQATLVDYLCFVYSSDYNSFGYYNSGGDTPSERIHKIFKNVVSYLLVAEDSETSESEDALKLDNLTFKDFKLLLMEKIVDYQQNPSETAKENSARYITIFNLISAQFNYSDSTNVYIGTSLRAVDLTKDSATTGNPTPVIKYKPLSGSYVRASFVVDKSTRNNILNLAGLANRPIEELVNLEYDKLYDRNGMYDEANGDIFVVCSYNQTTGKYIPYLACSNDYSIVAGSKFEEYKRDYFSERSLLRTDYYDDSQAYPIIARGIINSTGEPTAIKIVDNKVVFYRTTVLASASLSDDAISATMAVSEVNTVGYTETVESTSYKKLGLFSGRTTMFIGSSDIKSYISSKANVFFLQNEIMYDLPKDDFDGISVLDEFSSHYNLDFQTYFLLIMSFATLVPFLFNATAAVLRRILDLIFLILIGPVMISMKSFDYNDNGKGFGAKAFDSWKNMVSQALLSAFGYIIGFNVYYILVSSVLTMSFVSPATMTNINRIGGLSLLSVATVNTILRFLYVLTAVSIIKAVANMLTNIVTSGKVSNAFVSPVGGDEPMESVKAVVGEVKSMAEKTAGVVNGQALLDLKNAAFEQAKNMVPGSAIVASTADNVKVGVDYFKSRAMQKSMQAAGVDKKVAKQAAKQFRETNKQQREIKQANRVASANRFMTTYTHYISEEEKKKKKDVEDAFGTNVHIMPGIIKQLKPPKKEKKDKGKKDKAKKGKKKK